MKSSRSSCGLKGRVVRCTEGGSPLIMKFKPDAGTISRKEIDWVMSMLDDVFVEVERRCAVQAAQPAPKKSSL